MCLVHTIQDLHETQSLWTLWDTLKHTLKHGIILLCLGNQEKTFIDIAEQFFFDYNEF